ncbi:hypothetical protein HSIEG1_1455 [Enterococcus sp. HSIEG1]|nr:hypothetical protein HSIEG1_1455 [Enterococcus sp. HSIEG1]
MSPDELEKMMPGLNVKGYWEWDLNNYVQEFIKRELEKQGLHLSDK